MLNTRKAIASRHLYAPRVLGPGFQPGILIVASGKIESISPLPSEGFSHAARESAALLHAELEVFEDRYLTPAFVNAHTHLTLQFLRGVSPKDVSAGNMVEDFFFAIEKNLTFDDVRSFARISAWESLLNGVAVVWDHYYFGEAVAQAMSDAGLAGVVAPTLQDLSGPGVKWCDEQWETTNKLNCSGWKNKGIYAAFGPHATDTVSTKLWEKIADSAAKLNLPVHAHVGQSFLEVQEILHREGTTPGDFLIKNGYLQKIPSSVLIHGICLTQEELIDFQKERVTLGFCPFSQTIFHVPAPVQDWDQAKVPWFVGTDCSASNDSMNVQKELRYVNAVPSLLAKNAMGMNQAPKTKSDLVQKYMDMSKARIEQERAWSHFRQTEFLLDKVWETPGKMHPSFRCGTLEPGALAHLIVWDERHPALWHDKGLLHSLALGDTSGAIFNMMVNGRWRGRHGQYAESLLNEEGWTDALWEANERLEALWSRLKK